MGNEKFEYLIADIYNPAVDIQDGFVVKTIPAFTWAVFPCKGALPYSMQDVNTKIFSEWLPALQDYEFAAGYCIDMYDAPNKYPNGTSDENYYTEIWIPVRKNEYRLYYIMDHAERVGYAPIKLRILAFWVLFLTL